MIFLYVAFLLCFGALIFCARRDWWVPAIVLGGCCGLLAVMVLSAIAEAAP